ncbi:hypothetical protein HC928_00515 [bacterium]|nr:hypothetical protein [bacterium]
MLTREDMDLFALRGQIRGIHEELTRLANTHGTQQTVTLALNKCARLAGELELALDLVVDFNKKR